MSEQDSELRNPDIWDIDQAVVRPGIKNARAVVSVAFTREDFERVSNAAQQVNEKTSEFIRGAALDKASAMSQVTEFRWEGTSTNMGVVVSAVPVAGTVALSKADGGVQEEALSA